MTFPRPDARWFVLTNNAWLLFWGLTFFELQRSAFQIVTCFATTLACELALAHQARAVAFRRSPTARFRRPPRQ